MPVHRHSARRRARRVSFLAIASSVLPKLIALITDDMTIKNAVEMKAAASDTVKAVTGAATLAEAKEKIQDPAVLNQLKID